MKKLIVTIMAVFAVGCNWGDSGCPDCSCSEGCCESGTCSVADCGCSCKEKG